MKSESVAIFGIAAILIFVLYNSKSAAAVQEANNAASLNNSFPAFNLLYPIAPDNYVGSSIYSGVPIASPIALGPTAPNPVYYNYGQSGQGGALITDLLGQL